jgi:hypothetical protein
MVFGASKPMALSKLAKIGQCYLYLREIDLILNKFRYLGTVNLKLKILQ